MPKHNPDNERIKHKYRIYLMDARGCSESAVDQAMAALHHFEMHTKHKPFSKFHIEQARAFTRSLKEAINPKTRKPYSRSTVSSTLGALRRFFEWFAGQPESKKRISYGDADYFRLTEKEERVARATRPQRISTIDEFRRVIGAMPSETDIDKRNRALLAFLLLTSARIGAIRTACLKHINIKEGKFHQDARDVKTKRSKTFYTTFPDMGHDVRRTFEDWVAHLTDNLKYGPDDALFPKTRIEHDGSQFKSVGLERVHWSSDGPIRKIVSDAFKRLDLPVPNPHSVRHMVTQHLLGECQDPEMLKAWSQNIGHDYAHELWRCCA